MTGLEELFAELGYGPDNPLPEPTCWKCGRPNVDRLVPSWCINGCCFIEHCPDCGERWWSNGPAGCRHDCGGPNPLSINGHAYRRRVLSRRGRP